MTYYRKMVFRHAKQAKKYTLVTVAVDEFAKQLFSYRYAHLSVPMTEGWQHGSESALVRLLREGAPQEPHERIVYQASVDGHIPFDGWMEVVGEQWILSIDYDGRYMKLYEVLQWSCAMERRVGPTFQGCNLDDGHDGEQHLFIPDDGEPVTWSRP